MGSRYEVEVTITSATNLKNVNWRHGNLNPYAVVWLDPQKKCSTRADDAGDTSPYWGDKLLIPFNSPIEDSTLYIDIVHADAAEGTKPLVGSAKLPLGDTVDDAERDLELRRPSGRPQGKLQIKVTVREPRDYAAAPYGVPAAGYPATYGQQQGYAVEEKKKSGFGGMGAGLAVGAVAGAVGGVALAEGFDALEDNIADDAAQRVEDDDLGYGIGDDDE